MTAQDVADREQANNLLLSYLLKSLVDYCQEVSGPFDRHKPEIAGVLRRYADRIEAAQQAVCCARIEQGYKPHA